MVTIKSTQAETVNLTNGDVAELFYLRSGTEHNLDTRSYYEKLREKLPRRIQDLAPAGNPDNTWISMSGPDSLGIALRWSHTSGAMPAVQFEDMVWILSDNAKWYNSDYGTGAISGNGMIRPFPLAARAPDKLTLSLYSRTRESTPGAFLGKIELKSPRYDASVRALKSTPPPKLVKAGPLEIEIQNLFTEIYLDDLPKLPFLSFLASATDAMTSSILKLSQGKAQKAALPQYARSALVFRPRLHGKPADNISNITMAITDSKGKIHSELKSRLYKGLDAWVFLLDTSLPITDGNYKFELTVLENPPSDSTDWTSMAPLTAGPVDRKSTISLNITGKAFRAGMTEGADRINLETDEDPSLLSIAAEQTRTSETLAVSSFEGRRWDQHYRSTLTLGEPVASGSVTIKFAKPIEHTIKFSGVPERP